MRLGRRIFETKITSFWPMITYFISDIHVDFYCPQSSNYDTLVPYFEDFYEKYFLPADAVCIAGDIANDYFTQVSFLRFLSAKYGNVFAVFGNHDLVVSGATFGNGNPFSTSQERMDAVKRSLIDLANVHILDGNVVDGIGGSMGMCDLKYSCSTTVNVNIVMEWQRRWFDGRHWRYDLGNENQWSRNDPMKIWAYEKAKMDAALALNPSVMVTHFCPTQMGVDDKYKEDYATAFFYFDGDEFLSKMKPGSIWQCGHTHSTWDTEYNGVRIICNPLGYPDEQNGFMLNKKNETFLIDVCPEG